MLRGRDGVVKFGTDTLGGVQSWTLDSQTDVVRGWGMGDTQDSAFTTISRFTGSVEVYLDPADPSWTITNGDSIDIELYPGGETTGSGYFSGTVIVSDIGQSGDKGGIPTRTINIEGSGNITQQTVA